MTNILEKLRASRTCVGAKIPSVAKMIAATLPEDMLVMLPQKVVDEAADEIERLRGEIKHLNKVHREPSTGKRCNGGRSQQ